MKDRLDFVLPVIKRDYNTNDRFKFILSFIRRENSLNKIAKARQKRVRKVHETRIKVCKTNGDHQGYIE